MPQCTRSAMKNYKIREVLRKTMDCPVFLSVRLQFRSDATTCSIVHSHVLTFMFSLLR